MFLQRTRWSIPIINVLSTLILRAESQPPTSSPAPANPLIGRWQILATGAKKLPADMVVAWTFDERTVVVTLNGEVRTRSTYVLKAGEERPVIELTEWGKSKPDRVGWYEIREGHLRLQLSVFTPKPSESWNEDEVMVFRPITGSPQR